jgi:hypothetical protein
MSACTSLPSVLTDETLVRRGISVLIGSIIAAIVCAAIAGMKGRNPFGWGIPRLVLQHHYPDRGDRDPEQEIMTLRGPRRF